VREDREVKADSIAPVKRENRGGGEEGGSISGGEKSVMIMLIIMGDLLCRERGEEEGVIG
jgi:hypothetical protein